MSGAFGSPPRSAATRVFLVRHCSALGQEPDAGLTEAGLEQSLQLAQFLAQRGIERIVSSPYRRAVDSARPLASLLKVPLELDERLAERRLGEVSGGDWVAALRRSFDEMHVSLPGGESSSAAQARGRAVVQEVLAGSWASAAIFSHGNLLSLIANSFDPGLGFDHWVSLSNPDVHEVRHAAGRFLVERVWR